MWGMASLRDQAEREVGLAWRSRPDWIKAVHDSYARIWRHIRIAGEAVLNPAAIALGTPIDRNRVRAPPLQGRMAGGSA